MSLKSVGGGAGVSSNSCIFQYVCGASHLKLLHPLGTSSSVLAAGAAIQKRILQAERRIKAQYGAYSARQVCAGGCLLHLKHLFTSMETTFSRAHAAQLLACGLAAPVPCCTC